MAEFCYQELAGDFDLDLVSREIESLCKKRGLSPQRMFTVQLVVEEFVTNIKKYGARSGGETVEVRLTVDGGKAYLRIMDDAMAFNPLERSDPDVTIPAEARDAGGLGLFLVRTKVSSLQYEYANNHNIINAVI